MSWNTLETRTCGVMIGSSTDACSGQAALRFWRCGRPLIPTDPQGRVTLVTVPVSESLVLSVEVMEFLVQGRVAFVPALEGAWVLRNTPKSAHLFSDVEERIAGSSPPRFPPLRARPRDRQHRRRSSGDDVPGG